MAQCASNEFPWPGILLRLGYSQSFKTHKNFEWGLTWKWQCILWILVKESMFSSSSRKITGSKNSFLQPTEPGLVAIKMLCPGWGRLGIWARNSEQWKKTRIQKVNTLFLLKMSSSIKKVKYHMGQIYFLNKGLRKSYKTLMNALLLFAATLIIEQLVLSSDSWTLVHMNISLRPC